MLFKVDKKNVKIKSHKILKDSLEWIPSPSPLVKIQIMEGKVCLKSFLLYLPWVWKVYDGPKCQHACHMLKNLCWAAVNCNIAVNIHRVVHIFLLFLHCIAFYSLLFLYCRPLSQNCNCIETVINFWKTSPLLCQATNITNQSQNCWIIVTTITSSTIPTPKSA